MTTLTIPIAREMSRKFHFTEPFPHDVRDVFVGLDKYMKIAGTVPSEPNPRYGHMNIVDELVRSKVGKAITKTITDQPELFHLVNRGCTILAESFHWDEQTGLATILLAEDQGEEALHGMPDGATTDAVLSRLAQTHPVEGGYLRLQIITGIEDREVVSLLAEGLNTSRQVAGWTMANFNGAFDWLKDILDERLPGDLIAYNENDQGELEVLDVIAILNLFHVDYCDGSGKSPNVSYVSKRGQLLKRVENQLSQTATDLRRLSPDLIFSILRLRDRIIADFPRLWGMRGNQCKALARLTEPVELPFSGAMQTYKVPDAMLFPLLAAHRAIFTYETEGDTPRWLIDPELFWSESQRALIDRARELFEGVGKPDARLTEFGRKAGNYSSLLDVARLCWAEMR